MRIATVVGAGLLVGGLATPAFAAPVVTLSTADEASASSNITVDATALPASYGNSVNFEQCRKTDADPTFNSIIDCDQSTLDTESITAGATSKVFRVFNGPNENLGNWGCGPLATGTPTCYIRLSGNSGTIDDVFQTLVYGPVTPTTTTTTPGTTTTTIPVVTTTTIVPPADIPEAPLSILLPGTAAVLAGAGIFIARRRSPKTSV